MSIIVLCAWPGTGDGGEEASGASKCVIGSIATRVNEFVCVSEREQVDACVRA